MTYCVHLGPGLTFVERDVNIRCKKITCFVQARKNGVSHTGNPSLKLRLRLQMDLATRNEFATCGEDSQVQVKTPNLNVARGRKRRKKKDRVPSLHCKQQIGFENQTRSHKTTRHHQPPRDIWVVPIGSFLVPNPNSTGRNQSAS